MIVKIAVGGRAAWRQVAGPDPTPGRDEGGESGECLFLRAGTARIAKRPLREGTGGVKWLEAKELQ